MNANRRKLLWLVVLGGLLLTPLSSPAKINLPTTLPRSQEPLTFQEKWVLEKLAQGVSANLKELAATQRNRQVLSTLRGDFLAALLADDFPNFKIHWHGVDIRHATITGRVDLEGGEVPNSVKLYNCVFTDRITMNECRFKRSLWIFLATFQKDVDGLRIEIDKNCAFNGCVFQRGLNLAWGRIGKEFSLKGTVFPSSDEAKFEGLEIGANILGHGVDFGGPVNFYRALVAASMEFNDAKFRRKADFSEIRVNGNLELHRAVFEDVATFSRAGVGKGLLATGLTFIDTEKFATFAEMRLGHTVRLEGSNFAGPVDFNGVTVGDAFIADKVFFGKKFHGNGLTVQNILSFQKTVFRGSVSLDDAEIGGQLNTYLARFEDGRGVVANGIKVGQLLKISNAFFAGPLDFARANIGGELRTDVAEREEGTLIEDVIFLKGVNLNDGQVSDLTVRGEEQRALTISSLNLSRLVVNRDLKLQNAEIGAFDARRLAVRGQTVFQNLSVTGSANFQDSNLAALEIQQARWPETPRGLNLGGLSYNSIVGTSPADILQWLNQAVFDTRNYKTYQTYLERIGNRGWADEVFISMKRREWGVETWRQRLNPMKWPILLFWDWPVGYGRKPQNIFWFALPFILIGAVVLDPRYLVGIHWPQKNLFCNVAARLLLSVDKFTPKLMEFGLEDKWQPPEISGLMQFFLHINKIMGKIFLSIFFIAIYAGFK